MSIEPHLVVTGHSPSGDATVVVDSHPDPITVGAMPGAEFFLMWGTADGTPQVGGDDERAPVVRPYFPGAGGSRVVFLRWAPHSSEPEPAIDPQQAADEVADKLPGLLDPFEDGDEGMHTTDSVDYGILLEGELVLTLDNDEQVTLRPGACVVQRGTRHTWQNRSDQPALMCFVLLGADRVA